MSFVYLTTGAHDARLWAVTESCSGRGVRGCSGMSQRGVVIDSVAVLGFRPGRDPRSSKRLTSETEFRGVVGTVRMDVDVSSILRSRWGIRK